MFIEPSSVFDLVFGLGGGVGGQGGREEKGGGGEGGRGGGPDRTKIPVWGLEQSAQMVPKKVCIRRSLCSHS